MTAEREALKRIWIIAVGSRGDIQPFVAVGAALVATRRYDEVVCLTNENYTDFAEQYGLRGVAISPDPENEIRNNPYLQKGLDKGDGMSVMTGSHMTELNKKAARANVVALKKELEAHGAPDLCVSSPLANSISLYMEHVYSVPFFYVAAQAILYNPNHMVVGLPTLPCSCLNRLLLNWIVLGALYDQKRHFQEAMGSDELSRYTKSYVTRQYPHPTWPHVVMMSPHYASVLYPNAPKLYRFVGTTVLTKDQQTKVSNHSSYFGGIQTRKQIEAFLQAQQGPPIYLGWGSMVCKSPSYMVELCARAVHHSQQRAIILGGVAKLSHFMLQEEACVEADIVDYAKQNILFVEQAPHEWLFEHVSATVHHGGAGTITAALRACKPTVVTPVFGDQFDASYVVEKLGVGVGFKKQFQRIDWKELGDAIRAVVESESMRSAAQTLGQRLAEESEGAQEAAREIDSFWNNYVVTGKFPKLVPPRSTGIN